MTLTPVDILHVQFKTSLRGYGRKQVDEFVRSVAESLEGALREKCDMQRRIESLLEEVARIHKIETTMSEALTLAQKTSDEVRASAHKQAEMILQEAEQSRVRLTVETQTEAEKRRAEIALLEAMRDRFEAELRATLTSYLELLDKHRPADEIRTEVA